jgi:CubicO group peptidase (beta-lactamase class C family)
MRPRDMAKIGQLGLDRGRWKGEQIISEGWIDAATGPQIATFHGEPYGYQPACRRRATPSGDDNLDSPLGLVDF